MLNIHNSISPRYRNSRDFFGKTRCTHSRQCLWCLCQMLQTFVAHLDSRSVITYTFLDDAFWSIYVKLCSLLEDHTYLVIELPLKLDFLIIREEIVILHILVNDFFQVLPEPARQFYKGWLCYSPKPPSCTSYSVVSLGMLTSSFSDVENLYSCFYPDYCPIFTGDYRNGTFW